MAPSVSSPQRRPRRAPLTVPVASRDAERAKPKKKRTNQFSLKGDYVGLAVIISVVLVILMAIAVPLRTYYSGQSEIARLNESIAAKQAQRDALIEDINKYNNEDFIKQEARRRLGMVEAGETAWRIIDPRVDQEQAVTTDPDSVPPRQIPWTEVVWDSIAEPAEEPVNLPAETSTGNPEAPVEQ